jgi:hypothetical protein
VSWEFVKTFAVGGLINVGFIENTNFIIVVSHNGRGIFNCQKGENIARNDEDIWQFFDDKTGKVKGFDVWENQIIQTHGLFGNDNLPKKTNDSWTLKLVQKNNFIEIVLVSPNQEEIVVGSDEIVEIKAFGFSNDEKFFVIAQSSDLLLYRRKYD